MKVAVAQIKPRTGDLVGNTKQILDNIDKAIIDKADVILFPETAITGYCCGALFESEKFIKDQLKYLDTIVNKTIDNNLVVVVGYVDFKKRKKFGLEITNSAATIQFGKITHSYDKCLLANGYHHEDKKYFTPGNSVTIAEVMIDNKLTKIATPICEDIWFEDHYRDIVSEMVDQGAEIILCPNYSYFYYGKRIVREELVKTHSKKHNIPMYFCNAVGVGDIVKNIMIFDGGSFAMNSNGIKIMQFEFFKEDYQTSNSDDLSSYNINQNNNESIGDDSYIDKIFSNYYNINKPSDNRYRKYKEIFESLVFEQKEMFDNIGLKKAQVHISGGVDSAVVAAIVVSAMGPENCVFVSNPTEYNGSETKGYAQQISDSLGVELLWNPTQKIYEAILDEQNKTLGVEANNLSKTTMQAVGRTVQGLSMTNQLGSGIVATGNETESILGWCNYADIGSIGVHSPIADLTKLEVFDMCRYINKRFGKTIIPEELFNGQFKPAAELVDAKEDPFDYNVMSGICASLIRDTLNPVDLINKYNNKELSYDYFPNITINVFKENKLFDTYDVSIYAYLNNNMQTVNQTFEQMVWTAFNLSKRSIYKSALAAPVVNISPRSRGFSSRETIINHYQPL